MFNAKALESQALDSSDETEGKDTRNVSYPVNGKRTNTVACFQGTRTLVLGQGRGGILFVRLRQEASQFEMS